ncbi:universal stress protein [Emcibacter sp. SYSU 3D8]|uniref:universal stress protein n=1 Tax=Emcibacter sp. SYSU 3D8 TaxID=3133969 RepID=UPI0031FF29AC
MYKRILVPVDGSDASNLGLREAMKLSGQDTRLRLLHAVEGFLPVGGVAVEGYYAGNILETFRKEGEEILRKAKALLNEHGLTVETEMVENLGGGTAKIIVNDAETWGADLIVLGTHGRRGLKRLVMGSDAEEVVRLAPVPVLLVRVPAAEG